MRDEQQLILSYLDRHASASAEKIGKFLHISPGRVRLIAAPLIESSQAHRVKTAPRSSGGFTYLYKRGPAPKPAPKPHTPIRIIDPWMLPAGFFQRGVAA